MDVKKSDPMLNTDLDAIVLKNSKDISELFKAIAHSSRIQILALLLSSDLEFKILQKRIHLSKTALSNHLAYLIQFGLILKKERGLYSITENGKQLISTSVIFFKDIIQEDNLEISRLKTQYQRGFHRLGTQADEMMFSIPSGAIYQPCWLSYLGAVAGILKSQNHDFDIVQVGGYSGYIFMVNIAKGKLCPSGPTAIKNWPQIIKNTQYLGFDIELYTDNLPFPSKTSSSNLLSIEDEKRASGLFNRVKSELNMNKIPCIIWGLGIPEYGIVNGFQDQNYLTSTYRWLQKIPETPINYKELQAPGSLQGLFFYPQKNWSLEHLYHKEIDQELFLSAYNFAVGKDVPCSGYIAGPDAFSDWAESLRWTENDPAAYHGNSYCGSCYQEARGIAAVFMHQMFQKYHGKPQGTILSKLVSIYQSEERFFRDFTNLFPFGFSGDLSAKKRDQGADLLKIIKDEEQKAVEMLEKLVNN